MIFSDSTIAYFSSIGPKVRSAFANSLSTTPYYYEDEPFHTAYEVIAKIWKKRETMRHVSGEKEISRVTIKKWESDFVSFGAIGLLPKTAHVVGVDDRLERLVVLIKLARIHENCSHALRLADALKIPDANLEICRHIQRCYGYGQGLDKNDQEYYFELQKILASVDIFKKKVKNFGHDNKKKYESFFPKDCRDSFQHKIELFKELSACKLKRKIRPTLRKYGIHQDRYYQLKNRFMLYGVWGLVDLTHTSRRTGEKISSDLELTIIEQRLMNPNLSPSLIMDKLKLKCSRANVQKIFTRWGLSKFKNSIEIRGVVSTSSPKQKDQNSVAEPSSKTLFPDLIHKENLKVNRNFKAVIKRLRYRKINLCNPGAIIIAPFINQLGIIEALHTHGPTKLRSKEITNDILVNILRVIAGFPTINDLSLNSDISVAIGSGLALTTKKTRIYDSYDDLRFRHLNDLRNDLSRRAKELDIIDLKQIAIDYHCDKSYSRYPDDKEISKAPGKNNNMENAHRPQIIWDCGTNSIINIAYCEGKSRAPTALYNFLEENLFKIIDSETIEEIYADSEYTGEKQLVYLIMRSASSVTMCLKQNYKIKKWRDEAIAKGKWERYGTDYRIVSKDFSLFNGNKIRLVVKQNLETNETRCFGSTHCDWSPKKILNSYHLRWPVETGIKDLVQNYFLNSPIGTSAEKNEAHYYCIMAARLAVDYFLTKLAEPKWNSPEGWKCVLSTIRTTIFSSQNCELSVNDSGDLLLTYLDGDLHGIKKRVMLMFEKKLNSELWKVPWWGFRGLKVKIKNQFAGRDSED